MEILQFTPTESSLFAGEKNLCGILRKDCYRGMAQEGTKMPRTVNFFCLLIVILRLTLKNLTVREKARVSG
jgi:hypothetical protein